MSDEITLRSVFLHSVERERIKNEVSLIISLFRSQGRKSLASAVYELILDRLDLEKTNVWDRKAYIDECFAAAGIRSSCHNGYPVYRDLDCALPPPSKKPKRATSRVKKVSAS